LSHFFLDRYPKWYNKENQYGPKEIITIIVEILLMAFVGFVLFHQKNWFLWAGAISANLPDLWDAINVLRKKQEFWFCHPNGWFPVKVIGWQGTSMTALQTATLDSIFIITILMLVLF
jgi:hypothetical protein